MNAPKSLPQYLDDEIDEGEYLAYKQLWAAVLWQGLIDAVRLCCAHRRFQVLIHEEAKAWFASDETTPGSFRWICGDVLEIDPMRVRERAAKLLEDAKRNGGKTQRWLLAE